MSTVVCPACEQQAAQTYMGRLVVTLDRRFLDEAALRRRIANVTTRAAYTQPSRRTVSIERRGDTLEVLTTSQKLAHRITTELAKVWRGHATYRWADDGTLFARWRPSAPV
jgi:NMD protein affecting ribosome stability and mRNA decay